MHCSFCNASDEDESRVFVSSPDPTISICSACVSIIYDMVVERAFKSKSDLDKLINDGELDMIVDLKFVYKNADTYETLEDNLSLEVNDVKASELIKNLIENPDQEKLLEFFRHLFGNPDMDGSDNLGINYQELFTKISTKAWKKLGWEEVTIDILEISVGEDLNINVYSDGFDLSQLSLQLAHDDNGGFMYLYS